MNNNKETSNRADSKTPLLDEFTASSLETWQAECERLLRGAPFAKKMFTKTVEGITVSPMYTAADTESLDWQDSAAGQAPYVRGTQSRAERASGWLIAQELPYPTCAEFNNALRSDLKRGQNAVNLLLDVAGQEGLDPDQADALSVGNNGVSIAAVSELETALDGVDLENTPLLIQSGSAALPITAMLLSVMRKRGSDVSKLRGCLGSDPVCGLAQIGKLPLSMGRIYDEVAALTKWGEKNAPLVKTIPVFEDSWHNGGADCALSLGLILSTAVNHLRELENRDIPVNIAARRIQFNLCIGTDFFMEIAKIRALRMLWFQVLDAAGCGECAGEMRIHARTSSRTQTTVDPHVNLLRSTTEAMSAVLGGVDCLHVSPFDEVDSLPDEFSRRVARNVQLMLSHECHFDHVVDPAGGSWYVESLTEELAKAAWTVFTETEKAGGIVAGLKTETVQKKVAAAANTRRERMAIRKDVFVGVNQYANPLEKARTPRTIDHTELHETRKKQLLCLRTSAVHEDHMLVLSDLEKVMESTPDLWLNSMLEAATRGATIGELTATLRHDTDGDLTIKPIPLRRDSEPFEKLRSSVAGLAKDNRAGARVFLANLGDVAKYMPRLDFARGFFQAGGFEVVGENFYTDVDAAVKAAAESGAGTVVLIGLDDTYTTMALPVTKGLATLPEIPMIVLAGKPADLLEDLTSAGVSEFIHLRSNLLEVLGQLAQAKGAQS